MKQELVWLTYDVHNLLVAASNRMFIHLIFTYLAMPIWCKTNNLLKTKFTHEHSSHDAYSCFCGDLQAYLLSFHALAYTN